MESLTERPELALVLANCRPAHGTWNRCPEPSCRQFCNQVKGGYSLERAQRIIRERTAKALSPQKEQPPPPDSGRDW